MKQLTKIVLTLTIGSLNAFAIWNTCVELTGNFGKNKQQIENEIKSFELLLNSNEKSICVN